MAAGRRPDGFAALPPLSPRTPRSGEGAQGLALSGGLPAWRAAGAALGCFLGACAGLGLLGTAVHASSRGLQGARERLLGQAGASGAPPSTVPIPESLGQAGVTADRSLEVCSFERSGHGGVEGHSLWRDYAAWHKNPRSPAATSSSRLTSPSNSCRERLPGEVCGSALMKEETMANRAAGRAAGRLLVWHCLDDEDCAGLADELKGISTMLYLAMVSERALVLEWVRHGTDFSELLGQPSIDWRSPGALEDCTEVNLMGTVRWQLGEAGWRDKLHEIFSSRDPCLRVRSNAYPSAFMEDLSAMSHLPQVIRSIQDEVEQAVDREYLLGCALHFLFSFDEAYAQLLDGSEALVSCGDSGPRCAAAPARFVGVHLRFGDRVFEG
ncbi:unnamed protein product, partial [Prorocentrum cordatum]